MSRHASNRKRNKAKKFAAMLRIPNDSRVRNWVNSGMPVPTRPETTHCELCDRPFGPQGSRLDHCHITRKFRGWLCNRCNVGLGVFNDSSDGLRRALWYVERFEETVNHVPKGT